MSQDERDGEQGGQRRDESSAERGEEHAAASPPKADGGPPPSGLSERDLSVLAVERRDWAGPGMKERAIREQLDMSPTRYYQLLNALLDDPRALARDPVTVNRLRRRREAQRARR
jgi:hypothetical protein